MVRRPVMKPRTVHLLVLVVLCLLPACVGGYLVANGEGSHSDLSPMTEALGAVLVLGSAIYATVSSLVVWKLGTTPGRVLGVHFAIVAAVGGLVVLPRMYFMVHR
jgi:hypothetical protein